jgi:hypothetical protein
VGGQQTFNRRVLIFAGKSELEQLAEKGGEVVSQGVEM